MVHRGDILLTNPGSGGGPRIHSHDNSMFELERKGSGAVSKLDLDAPVARREGLQELYRLEKIGSNA